jgi:hypothetical protein
MSRFSYIVHQARRMQDNNLSCEIINSGERGTGKSTFSILFVKEYLDKFSFICPHCGNEFYKNIYVREETSYGMRFYIPDDIKNNKVEIECPEDFILNSKSGHREKISGCGKSFPISQRKKVRWSSERFIAYDNAQAYSMMLKRPIGSPIIFDEAINFMSSLDFNKAESKELKRLFAVIRPKRFLMFFNVPQLLWVDKRYRDDMAHFWTYIVERGNCIIFEKDKAVTEDPWHLKELAKIMGVLKYFSSIEKIKRNVRKHACFFDSFNFGELGQKEYDDYELVRNQRNIQRQVEEQELSNKDIAKIMSWNLLREWDSLKIDIERSRESKMTYDILRRKVLRNPVSGQSIASEQTVRNWIRGVDEYIESKGKDTKIFSDDKEISIEVEK